MRSDICRDTACCYPPLLPPKPNRSNASNGKQTVWIFRIIHFKLVMVRRCAWGTCTADCRYPEKLIGIRFITFPNPKTKLEKCLRWIKACGRPHVQLNVSNINQNKVICSTHFVDGNGPTDCYPDPVPADGSQVTPTRAPPKRRRVALSFTPEDNSNKENMEIGSPNESHITESIGGHCISTCDVECQTDQETRLIFLEEENRQLRKEIQQKDTQIRELGVQVKQFEKKVKQPETFTVGGIRSREKNIKHLFKYYTGITYVNFLHLLVFLFPNEEYKISYGRSDTTFLTNENALLLLLCRLRHDFGIKDLAMRFHLSKQSAGEVFNKVLDLMYFKFGQISIWPHRDMIISKMPYEFKTEFPNTLVIIDGTEFKTQSPSALGVQSQMYSDYKSSTTLKALIGCDPSGSVTFISELFTGSISDKMICEESGFFSLLKDLMDHGYIKEGDSIMADKGFTIHDELKKLGLNLNIPPFSTRAAQLSPSDTYLTQKIAKHRVHIERVIAKVKTYKLISHRIPTSLFKQANKIWSVSAVLTLYQDIFVKDK